MRAEEGEIMPKGQQKGLPRLDFAPDAMAMAWGIKIGAESSLTSEAFAD
jgi:hypothetical protein